MSLTLRRPIRRGRGRRRHRRGRIVLLIALAIVLVGGLVMAKGAANAEGLPQGTDWQRVFDDEFTGTKLDLAKWTPSRYGQGANEAPYNPDKEAAYYNQSAVSVAGGQAIITLKSVSPWIGVNGKYYGYSSGVMTTKGRFAVAPGEFVEARLKVPQGDGMWPAFWMTPADGSWPPETDIFEFFDTGIDKRPYFSYLNTAAKWSGPTQYGDVNADYRGTWHVYGLYWQKDGTMIPYIDGVAYPAFAKRADSTKPMFIILNLAIKAGGTPPAGATFRADWVRVYKPS